jgi:tRNA 5-methylaminomethyl-2-thiouridine biosynthesis bifunctional protein
MKISWPQKLLKPSVSDSGGDIRSNIYDDIFYSSSGAIDEKRYVFIEGNRIPERLKLHDRVTVLELGFGLGLNFIATVREHRQQASRCILDYVAFEKHPFSKEEMYDRLSRILGPSLEVRELVDCFPPLISGFHRVHFSRFISLTLIFGDAGEYIKELSARVDAIYLDGFAPAKNPELWDAKLFGSFRRLAAEGCTVSTYSSARSVRDSLTYSGFRVEKRKGFANKREMLIGVIENGKVVERVPKEASIIGGGIAGFSVALALSRYGVKSTMFEREPRLFNQASKNPLPLIRPSLSLDFGPRGRLNWYAFFFARDLYKNLQKCFDIGWRQTGVLQIANSEEEFEKFEKAIRLLSLSTEEVELIESRGARKFSPHGAELKGAYFSTAGMLDNRLARCAYDVLAEKNIDVTLSATVSSIAEAEVMYQRNNETHRQAFSHVFLCNASSAQAFYPQINFRMIDIPGQSSCFESASLQCGTPISGNGYTASTDIGSIWSSGTYRDSTNDLDIKEQDEMINLNRVQSFHGSGATSHNLKAIENWVGVRATTHDRLPLCGKLNDQTSFVSGTGTRGFTWSPIIAEIAVSEALGLSAPVERSLMQRMSPLRYKD